MHLTALKLLEVVYGQWLRRSDINWKDAVEPVSKFKSLLLELAMIGYIGSSFTELMC